MSFVRSHRLRRGTYLQDTIQQIPLPPREASPVGQDDQWQALLVHLLDCVCCFEGTVWVPDLPCLHNEGNKIPPSLIQSSAQSDGEECGKDLFAGSAV